MGICLVLHVVGITVLGEFLVRRRDSIAERIGSVYAAGLLMIVFSAVIVLHLVEALIWVLFYYQANLLKDFESCIYFSLSSYSTIGYGDLLLPERWRLLGTIEGVSGVLLCGLSAAFLFAIVNALFQIRIRKYIEEHTEA